MLATRMLALALAAIAAAGPRVVDTADGGGAFIPEDPPTLHVVLLDDSLSTARRRGDGTAFESLRRSALAVAENAGSADRFALVRTAKADPTTGPPRVLGPLGTGEYRRLVRAAEPRATAGDAASALAAAAALIDGQADRFPAARITLLTDRAAADWGGPAIAAGIERLGVAGRGLNSDGRTNAVRWVGPPGPGPHGRVVTKLSASAGDPDRRLDAVPRIGAPAELVATVRTFGPRPAGAVAFFVDDQFVGRVPLAAVGPRGGETGGLAPVDSAPVNVTVRAPVTFQSPGVARVEARLEGNPEGAPEPAALATRFAAIRVRGPLRVVILADRPLTGGAAADPAFYLEQALAADAETFAVTRATFDDPPALDRAGVDRAGVDAVAVVGAPPPPVAAAVRTFLEDGGGAFVTLRPTDDPADLRALFAGPLGAVRPAGVAGVADPADPAATGFTFEFAPPANETADEPAAETAAGDQAAGELSALRSVGGVRGGLTVGFRRLELIKNPPAGAWPVRVAARFEDEAGRTVEPAALMSIGPGGGRAALLATSVDATWGGPWPAAGASFVPLVRGLVAFAALPSSVPEATTGDVVTIATPPGRFIPAVQVKTPDGSERWAPVEDGVARVTGTDEPGFLRVAVGGVGERLIAVNAPAEEADPRAIRDGTTGTDDAAPSVRTTTAAAESRPLSAWVWAAALGALLIEPALIRGRRR